MKHKRLSVILSSLMALTMLSRVSAMTPEEYLQTTINESKNLLEINATIDQLMNSVIKLSDAIVKFQDGEIITQLIAPSNLKVENNILSWNSVANAQSYQIIIKNTENNIEQTITSTETQKDIDNLINPNIEYALKVKAMAATEANYTDSEFSIEIMYTKQQTPPPLEELKAPIITSLAIEDIISKKTQGHESDLSYKLDLNLKWDYNGDDSFIVKIAEGNNTTEVKVASGQRQLRLNQYITKETSYTIGILAKNDEKESALSDTTVYTAKNVCGHTNGFMISDNYGYGSNKAYAVSTPAQFEHINEHTITGPFPSDAFFQMNDINFNGEKYNDFIVQQMGNTYDGQGFMVDNFEIEGTNMGTPHIGVFGGLTNNTHIKDFGVGANATITAHAGYVGGVVGYGYCRFYRCYNFATVKSDGNTKGTGGITGRSMFTLEDCYNAGTIISTGSSNTGGLVGVFESRVVNMWNCYNAGNVTGEAETGGLSGASLMANELMLGNCYNTGKISGETGKTGALIGYGQIKTPRSVYYLDTSAPSTIGISKTDTYMQSETFVSDLKANDYSRFSKTENYIYPELNTNPHRNLK